MSIEANQQRVFLQLLERIRPAIRSDLRLPERMQRLLTGRRSFGSRDRRLYRELLYTYIRYLPWIETTAGEPDLTSQLTAWLAEESPATARYRQAALPDWPGAPGGVAAKAELLKERFPDHPYEPRALLPGWFATHCPELFELRQIDAIQTRSPLWVRLQKESEAVLAEWDSLGLSYRRSDLLDDAVEVLGETDLTQTESFAAGRFEIQDLASQLVVASVAPGPGERWWDACAGAGGKALQLAEWVGPAGRVDVSDPRGKALTELERRAARAGIGHIRRLTTAPVGLYDGVLVDAPCSGSGTWRRQPHLKWQTSPARVEAQAGLQRELLAGTASHVRPGGLLVYATCSLSQVENQQVALAFLREHPDFSPEPPARPFGLRATAPGTTLLPADHDSDGFFFAVLRRSAPASAAQEAAKK